MSIGLKAVTITLVIAGGVGCSKDVSRSETKEVSISETKGACADIHKSQVCTWAKMQGETLLEVGRRFQSEASRMRRLIRRWFGHRSRSPPSTFPRLRGRRVG